MPGLAMRVERVSQHEFNRVREAWSEPLPIWQREVATSRFGDPIYLLGSHGKVNALWAVPQLKQGSLRVAARKCRMVPYLAPVLISKTRAARRKMVDALFTELVQHVDAISLPMSPGLLDVQGLAARGALLEWRHTHFLSQPDFQKNTSRKVRNHLRRAIKRSRIAVVSTETFFDGERAIRGENMESVARRIDFARALLTNGLANLIEARENESGNVLGQAFVIRDITATRLLHSWNVGGSKARGVSIALIAEALEWSISQGLSLDLEGSVIPSIDMFFSSLNGQIVPYPFIHWCCDEEKLTDFALKIILSPERIKDPWSRNEISK